MCPRIFGVVLVIVFTYYFRFLRWLHRDDKDHSDDVGQTVKIDLGNRVALRFHDSCLRMSDVELLKFPNHLNDQIISFYFEYLEKEIFPKRRDWLFVSAPVTHSIRMVDEAEVGVFLDPLEASKKKVIFFALNDNPMVDQAGGTHWSLLVFSRPDMTFHHLDVYKDLALHNINLEICRSFMKRIKRALNCPQALLLHTEYRKKSHLDDSGVHVLCNIDRVIHQLQTNGNANIDGEVSYPVLFYKRNHIKNLIENLRRKAAKAAEI